MSLKSHKNRYRVRESEKPNMDEWMSTYGDMITLLMAFFVMMIAISKVDLVLFESIKQGLRFQIAKDKIVKTPLAEIKRDLDSLLAGEKEKKKVTIEMGFNSILMEFSSAALYTEGQAEINETAKEMIDKVSGAIKNIDYYPFQVDIEGHTDDNPIHTARFPSNWELSVFRATNIVKRMVETGVHAERLMAAGYADTKPKKPNRDSTGTALPENQATNRRIVVRIR